MSDKPFKETDWTDKIFPFIPIAILIVVFIMGVIIKQPCDSDKQYLWCKLHPASFIRILCYVVFNIGGLFLSGIWGKWFTLYNEAHKVGWAIAGFLVAALGMLGVWFL